MKHISPVLLEVLLFLKVEKAYWDIYFVCEAINNTPTEWVTDLLEDEERWEKNMLK